MSSALVLVRTLLLSTSQLNVYRHTTNKKKRRRIVGNVVGFLILHAMIMAYCIATCIGYGTFGMAEAIPTLCALVVCVLSFVFTLFKTNGYLFNFREYDMLMSLPFPTRTVAGCKFLYMYVETLPWYASISLATMIGYGIFVHPMPLVYPVWLVLSLLLPIIPMLGAAFLGFLIARISAGFRRTNIVQTVLTFAFVLFCFSLQFILDDMFENDKVEATLTQMRAAIDQVAAIYPPATWFSGAITRGGVLEALLLAGVSVVLFAVVFRVVGRSYRSINSAFRSHAAKGSYRMGEQRQRSVVVAIAQKELKRMTGSTTYMVNGAMGQLLAAILSVVTLVVGFDNMVAAATHDAPFDPSLLHPAIPLIVHFLVGMMATTTCSPSLEGRNYWIIQSLPLRMRTVYQGKMLFDLGLSVPAMAICTLCLCASAGVSVLHTALYLLWGLALCAFSATWGCVCGIRHLRLDWENEVEVVKQGAAVTIYLLPNMFVTMALVVGVVFLGMGVDHALLAVAFSLVAAALAALCYLWVLRLADARD